MPDLKSLFGIANKGLEELFGVAKSVAPSLESLFGINPQQQQKSAPEASSMNLGTSQSTPSNINSQQSSFQPVGTALSAIADKPVDLIEGSYAKFKSEFSPKNSLTFNVDKNNQTISNLTKQKTVEQSPFLAPLDSENELLLTETQKNIDKGMDIETARAEAGKKIGNEKLLGMVVGATDGAGLGKNVLQNTVSKLKPFQGLERITLKTLEALKGKTEIAKHEIIGIMNKGGVKQQEKDLINSYLDGLETKQGVLLNYDDLKKKGADIPPWKKDSLFELKKINTDDLWPSNFDMYDIKSQTYKDLEMSIKRGDKIKPLTADINGTLLDGNHRYSIYKKLGIKEVDVFKEIDKTKKQSNKVNIQEMADTLKAELLPLYRRQSGKIDDAGKVFRERYENVSLPQELRGNVAEYRENIYDSGIKTSAGQTHFGSDSERYFGHTRTEDIQPLKWDKTKNFEENQVPITRRVIEVQSDLYQKGNLEREITKPFDKLDDLDRNKNLDLDEYKIELGNAKNKQKELSKLQQYSNPTAHFRMVREEVKKAAEDGIKKLQFPTGETAMKIEGLGDNRIWSVFNKDSKGIDISELWPKLTPEKLKVGETISHNGREQWIITEVLEDGKFKAIPKSEVTDNPVEGFAKWEKIDESRFYNSNNSEQFDISGKVDKENPIYKFYEKELGSYLYKKYGAKLVKDEKGVSWYEVDVNPDWKNQAVEAFGFGSPKNIIQTLGAGIGTLTGIKLFKGKEGSEQQEYVLPPTKENGGIYEDNGIYKSDIDKNLLQKAVDDYKAKLERTHTTSTTTPGITPVKINKVIIDSTGELKRQGNTLALDNNNPGNLRWAYQINGEIGRGGFAKFPTPEEGFNALVRDIKSKLKRMDDLETLITIYSPPEENDTELYINTVANWLGIGRKDSLKKVDATELAKHIARFESQTIIE